MDDFQKRRLLHNRRVRKRTRSTIPWLIVALAGVGALASLAAVTSVGVAFGVYQSYANDYVPIEDKLRQSYTGLTEIYDRGGPEDGVFLGALSNPDADLLEPVPLDQMSNWVIEATISTEDNGFWEHPGVSFTGLMRAAYENYVLNDFGAGSGGSTITQQLIKNVYICPNIAFGDDERCVTADRTLDRKLREITYAMELERDYTKAQILQWYLNQISYADRYIGIQAAAQGYFRKDAADLNLAEAALLAGVPAAPSRYHPRTNCVLEEGSDTECVIDGLGRTVVSGAAKERQEAVLDLMVEHGRATAAEVAEAKAFDLRVYPTTNPIKASAFIDNQVEPRLVRMCEAGLFADFNPDEVDCKDAIHGAGYRVTTTLDWAETQRAVDMMNQYISDGLAIPPIGCNCHNAAIVTIEPSTGQVIVYAANVNPNDTRPQVAGKIDQANEINQPGSSFKPAVYLAWFDYLNKAPMSPLWDTSPLEIQGVAITNPRGGGFKSEGLISARAGLGGSQNVPAFRAAYEVGADNVIEMAKKLGITTLHQGFDPTFVSHTDVTYGASIATGGANIRVIDMAYMNSVIANMGVMVGVPHYADEVAIEDLRSTAFDTGVNYDRAIQQSIDFAHGHIRIPGTRELDPVVVLEVRDIDGNIVYSLTDTEVQKRQVVDAGSVWLLNSITSDCTARYIIWGCGGSNDDNGLDWFLDGSKVPAGVKTGTQQGFTSAIDTLEVWTNGYSRYAATAVWVGNANNENVNDGPGASYAAAHTVLWLYKNWMSEYHRYLRDERGVFTEPAGFDDLRPPNVSLVSFNTPITSDGNSGGCQQMVGSWVRTDVTYESVCEKAFIDTRNGLLASDQTPSQYREERSFVLPPSLRPELAEPLARQLIEITNGAKFIPIKPTQESTGQPAIDLVSPPNGATISRDTDIVGTAASPNLKSWSLEIGQGASPTEWTELGAGTSPMTNSVLGRIQVEGLEEGVYIVRITAKDALLGDLSISVFVNVRQGGSPFDPFDPGGGNNGDDDDDGDNGNGIPSAHPTGFQECIGGCGEPPLLVICGPRGWFIDKNRDYNNREDWPSGFIDGEGSVTEAAERICGG